MPEKYPSREQHGFSRLETDDELTERVRKEQKTTSWERIYLTTYKGDDLDTFIWRNWRMQRKIIRP